MYHARCFYSAYSSTGPPTSLSDLEWSLGDPCSITPLNYTPSIGY